jgi:hemoglobin
VGENDGNSSDYERLGGGPGVERLVRAFLARVFDDLIIGFQFEGRDHERIVRHEVEHATRLLGGPAAYTGRPLGAAHRPLKINRGQFRRRLAILRTVLREQGVEEEVIGRWIAHDEQLLGVITDGTDCLPTSPTEPTTR